MSLWTRVVEPPRSSPADQVTAEWQAIARRARRYARLCAALGLHQRTADFRQRAVLACETAARRQGGDRPGRHGPAGEAVPTGYQADLHTLLLICAGTYALQLPDPGRLVILGQPAPHSLLCAVGDLADQDLVELHHGAVVPTAQGRCRLQRLLPPGHTAAERGDQP